MVGLELRFGVRVAIMGTVAITVVVMVMAMVVDVMVVTVATIVT